MWGRSVALVVLVGCGRFGFADQPGTGDGGGTDGDGDGGGSTVALVANAATINLGSKSLLTASGGQPPYTFAVKSGAGTITGDTFIAPGKAGQSIVEATDALGATGTTTVTYQGSRLFVIGGFIGTNVVGTVVSSSDGGATWAQVGSLPAPRANGAVVVYDDKIFYLGGLNAASAATVDVFSSSDGVTWMPVGMLPISTAGFTATVHEGAIWFVGGSTSAGNSGTAYHSSDGATWTAAPVAMPVVRHEHDLFSRNGSLYVLGGHGDTAFLDDIQITSDGTSWSSPTQRLTFACDFPAAGELGDLVIRTCGSGCTTAEKSTDLITWTGAAALPDGAREGPVLLGHAGRILLIGGTQTVQATTDGTSWSLVGSLPAARTRTGAVQFTPP